MSLSCPALAAPGPLGATWAGSAVSLRVAVTRGGQSPTHDTCEGNTPSATQKLLPGAGRWILGWQLRPWVPQAQRWV